MAASLSLVTCLLRLRVNFVFASVCSKCASEFAWESVDCIGLTDMRRTEVVYIKSITSEPFVGMFRKRPE